jgi:hypothetical protein
MIVDHNGSSPLPQVTNQIKSGLNLATGYWDGNGITSSTAQANATSLLALGVAEASDALNISGAQTAIFAGQTVDATSVLVKHTYFGDANLDGEIDGDDFFQFDYAISAQNVSGWYWGDFNYDGVIDRDNDFAIMVDAFHNQGGPMTIEIQQVIDRVMSVPEPGSGTLLCAAGGAMLARRRRRSSSSATKGVTR